MFVYQASLLVLDDIVNASSGMLLASWIDPSHDWAPFISEYWKLVALFYLFFVTRDLYDTSLPIPRYS